jgi:hypothetical protein
LLNQLHHCCRGKLLGDGANSALGLARPWRLGLPICVTARGTRQDFCPPSNFHNAAKGWNLFEEIIKLCLNVPMASASEMNEQETQKQS